MLVVDGRWLRLCPKIANNDVWVETWESLMPFDYACNQGSRSLVLGNFFSELQEKESGVLLMVFVFVVRLAPIEL